MCTCTSTFLVQKREVSKRLKFNFPVLFQAVVHEAPGISKAMTCDSKQPNENGRLRLKTEGVNIPVS